LLEKNAFLFGSTPTFFGVGILMFKATFMLFELILFDY
jgi:hypothetical protein